MYRVGIVGHTPEYFSDHNEVKFLVDRTLDLIKHQYGDDLVINLAADIGIAEWAADTCIEKDIKYHLFLPFLPQNTAFLWYEDQYAQLEKHFKLAWATSVVAPHFQPSDIAEDSLENYRRLVENARFIICFWNGMKQGNTFESIVHALDNNVLVINALNDRKLVTNEDIGR